MSQEVSSEDFEELIAKELNAKIGSHEWLDIRGNIFDIKHHIGSSSSPSSSKSSSFFAWYSQYG